MKDGIRVFLPDELEKMVKREADAEHVSPGEYISMVLKETFEDKEYNSEDFEETPEEEESRGKDRGKQVNIHLYGEDADEVKLKSQALGLNPTSYVRRLIYNNNYTVINVPVDDIMEFIGEFTKLRSSFTAAVGYIKRADGIVFKQDVELLEDYMGQLCELFKNQAKLTYATRAIVEKKMMKYIRDEIKKNKKG